MREADPIKAGSFDNIVLRWASAASIPVTFCGHSHELAVARGPLSSSACFARGVDTPVPSRLRAFGRLVVTSYRLETPLLVRRQAGGPHE